MGDSIWVHMLGGSVGFAECSGNITPTYKTRYLCAGEGDEPPLIFLHGLGGHAEAYAKNVVELAERFDNREVYAIDFIGTGYSDAPENVDFSITDYMDQVEDFINARGYDSAHLSGESLGSWVAGRLAIDRPELVETLTFNTISGVYYLDTGDEVPESIKEESRSGLSDLLDRTMTMIDEGIPRERVQSRMDWLFKSGEADDELVDIRHTLYNRPEITEAMPDVYETFLDNMEDPEYYFQTAGLETIEAPTLILHTEDNPSAHKALAEYVHGVVPDSTYLLYDDSGHWPQYEEPEKFNDDTEEFIKQHT